MSLLITRPDHDPTTRYFSGWSEKVLKVAKDKHQKIIDLRGDKATKREFEGRIAKLNPSLVMLNGHGSTTAIGGQDNEVLIEAGENEHMLHSRITYAVSCSCGKELGPEAVKRGDGAFIGYDDEFTFTSSRKYISKPQEDKRAKPFMDASNHVAISLLKGHKASDASKRSKEMFEKSYKEMLSSDADPNALQDARLLWWNMSHQVCLGNGEARM